MFKKFHALGLLFCLGIAIVFAVSACNSKTTSPLSNSAECRMIRHAAGETCIPLTPKRLVVLDKTTLEHVLALGQKPTAGPIASATPVLQPYLDGIVNVGIESGVSLERVTALKPDLIVGLVDNTSQTYQQLSRIAPTVLVEFEHSGRWKEIFALIGEVLGQSEQANQVMANYSKRLEDLQAKLQGKAADQSQKPLQQMQVSVVRLYPDMITLYTKPGFIGTILEDVGLSRPPSQDLDLAASQALGISPIQYSVSQELFTKADGDAMFLIVGNWDRKIQDVLKSLQTDPLWSKLKAVQQGKVFQVKDHWVGSGAIAANAVLDDLFKYLIGNSKL